MIEKIIGILNEKTGASYTTRPKKTQTVINARIKEGATLEDFIKAIENKVADWKGTDREKYLRPETLFGTKFWGYVNESKTDQTKSGDRRELIKAVLKACGIRDITEADITIYGEVLKIIKTEDLPQFAVSLIRNGGAMKRPDQMISDAVKDYEAKVITESMRRGKRINDYDRFIEFIKYAFRGKKICNNIEGLYKPFVTIGMDRDGYLVNQFSWKKITSEDEEEFYSWLFKNQHRVGDIVRVEYKDNTTQIEHKKHDDIYAVEREKKFQKLAQN